MKSIYEILLPYQRRFVDSKSERRVWLSSRQAGKSLATAFLAVRDALTSTRPSPLVLCISTGARAASEFLNKVEQMAQAVNLLRPDIRYEKTSDCVKFSTGARIMSLPSGNPSALRGWSAASIVLDEAGFIDNPKEVWAAISPTLTRDKEAKLYVVSTPAGKNSWFGRLYEQAVHDANWYCQTTTIYDAVADGLDIDVEELKKTCNDEETFRREYCCEFAESYGCMLDAELLEFGQPGKKDVCAYGGIDVARHNDNTAIADVVQCADGTFFVRDVSLLHGVEYQTQLDIIKRTYQDRKWSSAYIDATGLGGPIAEFAHKQISARIRPYQFTAQSKLEAYENFRSLVFDRKVVFAEHLRELVQNDVRNVQRIVTEGGTVKYQAGHDGNGHADAVSSLVLAFMAAKQHPLNASSPAAAPFSSVFGQRFSRL